MLDTILLPIIIFFFGAIIGSFLNVVILRHRSGRTLGGRSACFSCGKRLSWYELVPIGSFLSQKGKCSGCSTKISWQYPLVEALTGFLFVFLYMHFAYLLLSTPTLFLVLFGYYAVIFSLIIVLTVYDLKHKILPDEINYTFILIAFIGMFFIKGDMLVVHIPTMWQFLAGIVIPAPFACIWLVSKGKWMGLGDAKFMMGMGFLLGVASGVVAVLFAFWIGAIFGVLLIALSFITKHKGVSGKTAIPFGPFLALATAIVFLGNFGFDTLRNLFM
jgi:leader peptidase (prepilin peptidase)/N-methyltransferase